MIRKSRPAARSIRSKQSDPTKAHGDACEIRCECRSLLARRVAGGIELKCRRCKQIVLVYDDMEEA